ncbi:MAG: hypothetical protein MK213_10285, partial [Planctomycetes bacterium]|nr:hypothetical protein [Planctomycetota bacterium]
RSFFAVLFIAGSGLLLLQNPPTAPSVPFQNDGIFSESESPIMEQDLWFLSEFTRTAPPHLPKAFPKIPPSWGLAQELHLWEQLSPEMQHDLSEELRRCFSKSPGEDGRITQLEFNPQSPEQVHIRWVLEGPSAAILPWAKHLLDAPKDAGYLTDPRQFTMRPSNGTMEFVFECVVHSLKPKPRS